MLILLFISETRLKVGLLIKYCKTCGEILRLWSYTEQNSILFAIPMVQREPKNHVDDCYFCMTNSLQEMIPPHSILIQVLNASKKTDELLGLRHKAKNLFVPGTSFSMYGHKDNILLLIFEGQGLMVYSNNTEGLMDLFDASYNPIEWRLFRTLSHDTTMAMPQCQHRFK